MASRRPRTAAPRPQPPRTTYDDFDPKSEWKDSRDANVLNIYLPEFVKEQIRVRFDQVTKTLNVSAERPSGNNRIVRVNKDYMIPENSSLRDMKGKFENETLTITIAKETPSQVDPKLPEAGKATQESPSTQKPTPSAPPPPLEKQKSKEEPAKVPSQRQAEGKDFPDKSAPTETTKTKFPRDETQIPTPPAPPPPPLEKQKSKEKPAKVPSQRPAEDKGAPKKTPKTNLLRDEDEDENKIQVSPPSSTQKPPAVPPLPLEQQKFEEKPARIPSLLPDPWHEMEEGRDFPDPSVIKEKAKAKFLKDEEETKIHAPQGISTPLADTKKPTEVGKSAKWDDREGFAPRWQEFRKLKVPIPEKELSRNDKKPVERKENFSQQEMKMSNDIPGSEEQEMKVKEESTILGSRSEEIEIYSAARKAMLDLTMRIKEDRQLVINMGVAALVIVALGSYISYTIGLHGKGDNN